MAERVEHTLPPWWDPCAKVLILGTMPSPLSRSRGMYYGHPQNRFWRTLAALFNEPLPDGPAAARAFCSRHRIALWDVLASCTIEGASDASIRNAVPNDLSVITANTSLEAIFCTGRKAFDLFNAHQRAHASLEATLLPSPSAANRGHWPDDSLIDAYAPIRQALRQAEKNAATTAPFPLGLPLFTHDTFGEGEHVDVIYEDDLVRLERIVSWSHASPADGYYDQDELEWVSVLTGSACLEDENGRKQHLTAGDHCLLHPHERHRVAATSAPCIWLCLFRK